ncbi:major facilitator transporter [Microbacterium mangrovi]|uniref:Major facilitator transporter n=1 Tax=Microbacterium mangrovi TaxID=1348253 RepID=A0A0B2A4R3_9MICO|nr:MFS transporter [Microbacterium mangrovi]KHK96587.1 major facilitator transporter [Microbacterium mangrovi]
MHAPAPTAAIRTEPGADITLLRGGRAVALVATLILCVLSYQLNASMLTPALPDMAKELGIDVGAVSQVSSLFFLAGAIGGIVLSRWSDFTGRRRALFIVLGILAVGTLLCLFAPNLPVLLVGRALQGASSAAFQLAYIILSESLSAKVFGATLGIITAVNGGVGGVDGYIGGLLVENFGYRSIFAVILVVGAFAIACVIFTVPKDGPVVTAGKMDWWGAAALSVALICFTYFVSQGGSAGWLNPLTLTYLAAAIIAFIVFWFVEKRRHSPLIATRHLGSRQVWPVIATTVLTLSGVFAVINFTVVILSQTPKIGFGLDAATAAALFLVPPAMIGVVAAPLSGWLAGKVGWIRLLRVGLVLSLAAVALIAVVPQNMALVIAAIAVLGITYNGLVLTTVNGLGVLLSPEDAPAALPGLNGAAFGIGAGLGIGIVAPFVTQITVGGFTTALWISAGIVGLALVASLLIAPRSGQRI